MRNNYDFSKGKRGRVGADRHAEPGKVSVTIHLDEALIGYFGAIADRSGGKTDFHTLINSALQEYVERKAEETEPIVPGTRH